MKKNLLNYSLIAFLLVTGSVSQLHSQVNLQIPSADVAPVIDGTIEAVWDNVPATSITNILEGSSTTSTDFSAYFKTLWDNANLYG